MKIIEYSSREILLYLEDKRFMSKSAFKLDLDQKFGLLDQDVLNKLIEIRPFVVVFSIPGITKRIKPGVFC